jgi:hypothetical protein
MKSCRPSPAESADAIAEALRTKARRLHRLGRGAHVVVDHEAIEALRMGLAITIDPPTDTTPATVRA